jgi:hypothetical protein
MSPELTELNAWLDTVDRGVGCLLSDLVRWLATRCEFRYVSGHVQLHLGRLGYTIWTPRDGFDEPEMVMQFLWEEHQKLLHLVS